jgi:hypothetical protein
VQPSLDLRLSSMIKALSQIVLPSVDTEDKAAIEQLNIVIGSLLLLKEQIDYVHWFEHVETNSMLELVQSIAGHIGQEADAFMNAANTAADIAKKPDATLSSRHDGNIRLREVLAQLIHKSLSLEDKALAANLRRQILKYSEAQISRERAFVARVNLDVFGDNLLPIREALIA